jgi:transcriptional regulator with XRE-family HTH domain
MTKEPSQGLGVAKADAADIEIGLRLRKCRQLRGQKADECALVLRCAKQQIQKYESGADRISAANLYRLALQLDVPIDLLFPIVNRSTWTMESSSATLCRHVSMEASPTQPANLQ